MENFNQAAFEQSVELQVKFRKVCEMLDLTITYGGFSDAMSLITTLVNHGHNATIIAKYLIRYSEVKCNATALHAALIEFKIGNENK